MLNNLNLILYSASSLHAVRILGRRYALTPTSYKYLEIGISVGNISYVELALGDNRGNQIILPIETWRLLMQKRADIEQLTETPLWIRDLTFQVINTSNSTIIKITSSDNSLYMKPSTLLHLFDFDKCIDHMYSWLCENTHNVTEKFKQFIHILQRNNISDASNAEKVIRGSNMFDNESLVDCELIACAINDILYNASNK